jgi:hypothetical protein
MLGAIASAGDTIVAVVALAAETAATMAFRTGSFAALRSGVLLVLWYLMLIRPSLLLKRMIHPFWYAQETRGAESQACCLQNQRQGTCWLQEAQNILKMERKQLLKLNGGEEGKRQQQTKSMT